MDSNDFLKLELLLKIHMHKAKYWEDTGNNRS